jgi:hypothetical protein
MKIELKRHAPFSHAEKNGPMAMYTKNGDVPKVNVLQVHQFTFTKWSNRDVPGTHLFACQLTKTTAIGIKPICGCVVAPCGHLIQQ